MKRWSNRATSRLGLLAVAACAIGSAHGADMDPSPFIGSWVFQDGEIAVTCSAGRLAMPTGGILMAVRPSADARTDLELELGCHCRLGLTITAAGEAELVGPPQPCDLVRGGLEADGLVQHASLVVSSPHLLTIELDGNATVSEQLLLCPPSMALFSGNGTALPSPRPAVECGDDDTAVGVIPYGPGDLPYCPFGAGKEEVEIVIHSEDRPPCRPLVGALGEGHWALPDDTRERHRELVPPPSCSLPPRASLRFCRVDGKLFKAMSSGSDPGRQDYAVLKLGRECPEGSREVSKVIDNVDYPLDTSLSSYTVGRVGNNTVGNADRSSTTTLFFCYFHSSPAPMTAFPELGFPYAVLHSYTGEQPSWVIAKSWIFSRDDNASTSYYVPPDLYDFQDIVENPLGDTYFDIARVR